VFTTRYGLTTRRTALRYVFLEGYGGFVTSAAAPIASGWSDQTWPGGTCTHWDAVPYHGAHHILLYSSIQLSWLSAISMAFKPGPRELVAHRSRSVACTGTGML
jgi:hypothetical protein